MGFSDGSAGQQSVCNAGDAGLLHWLGRFPGGEYGNTLQYCLENPKDRGAWQTTVHGVAKSGYD